MVKRRDTLKGKSGGGGIGRFFIIMAAMVFCIVLAGAAHAQQKKKDSPLTKPQPQSSDKVPAHTIMPSEVPSLGPATIAPPISVEPLGPPDLAVMDLFVDNNCQIIYTLKNKGGGFSNDSNSMQIDFCTNNNTCFTYSVGLNSLKPAGGQETHQVPSTTKYYISPPSVQPITLKIYPEYYNIPDANPSNNSLTRNLQCAP